MATKNFRQECLLGEGGFGRVFKGMIHASGKVMSVLIFPSFFKILICYGMDD